MLPLSNPAPRSAVELAEALARGLAAQGVAAEVSCEGEWPELQWLRLDVTRIERPRRLAPVQAKETLRIQEVRFVGRPVQVEGIPVELAANIAAARAGIADGSPAQLVLLGAASGAFSLEVRREDLEDALRTVLDQRAQAHGAAVKTVQLDLQSPNVRTLEFTARVTAKAFIATTTLTVRGRIEVDGELCAHVRELALSGEGMMANIAQGFLEPHVAQWRGRMIRLGDYVAAGLRVRDVSLTVGEKLKLEAAFVAS